MTEKKPTSSKKKEKTIAWEAYEFEYIPKTVDWYWVVGSVGALIALGSYFLGNWSFALLVIVSTITLMLLSVRRPGLVRVKLNHKTISLNDRTYYLKKFDTFNIDEERSKLLLHAKTTYKPVTVIPLPPQAPSDKITNLLEDHLDMEINPSLAEPLFEVIMHRWGF